MLHCVVAPELPILLEKVQGVLAALRQRKPDLKEHRLDPEGDLAEVPAKLKSINLFGDTYAYYLPWLDAKRFDPGLFNDLLAWAKAGEFHHAFVFGVTEEFDHPLWDWLEGHALLHRSGAVRKEEEWREFGGEVVDRVLAARGKRLAPDARREILHRCFLNPERLRSELEKVCDYAPGATVDLAAVRKVVGDEHFEEFGLLRALQERDARALLKEVNRQIDRGEPVPKVLAALASELRFYLLLKSAIPKEEQMLDQRGFMQRIYPKLQPLAKPFGAVEEKYGRRFKSAWGLYHVYAAVAKYSLRDLVRLMKALAKANLMTREGVDPHELMHELVFLLGPPRGAARPAR
jgi:DNA polymerase III delta subunit